MDRFVISRSFFRIFGRTLTIEDITWLCWSGSGIEFNTRASEVTIDTASITASGSFGDYAYLGVICNDDTEHMEKIKVDRGMHNYKILDNPDFLQTKVTVVKLSETRNDKIGISCLYADAPLFPAQEKKLKILFLGDSMTAGYGVDGGDTGTDYIFSTRDENAAHTYAYMTAADLDAEFQMIAWSGNGIISQYIEPDTDIPVTECLIPDMYPYTDKCSEEIIKFYYSAHGKSVNVRDVTVFDPVCFVPDIIVSFLGTNDATFIKDVPSRAQKFVERYTGLLRALKADYPKAQEYVLYGTMEQGLSEACYHAAFLSGAEYIQLPLQDPADGLGACGHPSLVTHRKIADTLTGRIRQKMSGSK